MTKKFIVEETFNLRAITDELYKREYDATHISGYSVEIMEDGRAVVIVELKGLR